MELSAMPPIDTEKAERAQAELDQFEKILKGPHTCSQFFHFASMGQVIELCHKYKRHPKTRLDNGVLWCRAVALDEDSQSK